MIVSGIPPEAVAVSVLGAGDTSVYVDPFSGRILTILDPGRRVYDWLSYGVHTFNFPGLSSSPMLRTLAVMLLVTGGLTFSITALVLGLKRAGIRPARPAKRRPVAVPHH
jgi:hypothetical protein